jgi:predicted ester cyclase
MEPHEMLAEGDMVCARVTFSGTHQGEFMGLPPTGKRIEVDAIDIVRIRDGQVAEHWGVFDAMLMMQQLGAIPEGSG